MEHSRLVLIFTQLSSNRPTLWKKPGLGLVVPTFFATNCNHPVFIMTHFLRITTGTTDLLSSSVLNSLVVFYSIVIAGCSWDKQGQTGQYAWSCWSHRKHSIVRKKREQECVCAGKETHEGRGSESAAGFCSRCQTKALTTGCHWGFYDNFHKNSSMHFTQLSLLSKTLLCNGVCVE